MNEQDELLKQIKHSLDKSAQSLDGQTRSQLSQARAKALQESESKNYWLPVGGFAFAFALVMVVTLFNPLNDSFTDSLEQEFTTAMLEGSEDLEIIATMSDPESLEELDFYYWLEQGGNHAG